MGELGEIEKLLQSQKVVEISKAIATEMGCTIYEDNLPILIGFLEKEVKDSRLSATEINSYIDSHSDEVVRFGLKLLKDENAEILGIGFPITYAIYLIYLDTKEKMDLLEFIKRRRIPQARRFLQQLLQIREECR